MQKIPTNLIFGENIELILPLRVEYFILNTQILTSFDRFINLKKSFKDIIWYVFNIFMCEKESV